jgi:hypothetical protein
MRSVTLLRHTVRFGAVGALLLGISYRLGAPIPIHAHIAFGSITLIALWLLAGKTLRRDPVLAVTVALTSLIIPALGLSQMSGSWSGISWLAELAHPLAALAGVALAEGLAKRLLPA